ncbi:MAG: outer membrane beta-barrel protein [Ignavibacteriae bacterium]|nr:outer membrane beta-barrel protein [Ignavibacteriota bacterium]
MRYIILLLLSITYLNAVEVPLVRESSSDQALMFELSTIDDQLINNYIYGLGYRWYFSDNWSLGIGMGFNSNEFDESTDTVSVIRTSKSWGLNPSIRYNFSSNKNIIGFIGLDYSYYTSTSTISVEVVDNKQMSKNNSAGLFIGADWFFTKNISLTTQYRISYGLRSQEHSENNDILNRTEESFSQLGMDDFKLGLSLYFN